MLDVVKGLKPVIFDWKPGYIEAEGPGSYAEKFPRNLLGFVAQDVESLVPQAIQTFNTTHAPDFRTFNKAELLPAVVGAVQATAAKVDQLQRRLDMLEEELRYLKRFIKKTMKKTKKK